MNKLNNNCMSDRGTNASVYRHMRSEAKKMIRELKDPSIKGFCESMLARGECWTFLYFFLRKGKALGRI